MVYVIVVVDLEEDGGEYKPTVFGGYTDRALALELVSVFPERYDVSVVPLRGLTEELDNPWGAYWRGDSPDD